MSERSVEESSKSLELEKKQADLTREKNEQDTEVVSVTKGPVPVNTTDTEPHTGMQDLREEEEKRRIAEGLKKTVEEAQKKGQDLVHNPTDSVLTSELATEEEINQALDEVLSQLEVVKKETTQSVTPQQEQEEIQQDMDQVLAKGFEPVVRATGGTGFWAKVKNRVKVGVRWAWAATFGSLISAIGVLVQAPEKVFAEKGRVKRAQKERDHDTVPGRNEKFGDYKTEYDEEGKEQVYSDVRRGPLVWEKLSAGDPEDPPEVIIMVEQSKRGSGAALESLEMGHAMIGLSYSRYNKTTRRKERYRLQMGFYPKGGMVGVSGTLAMTGGAIMPGQLKDDTGHHYDIARRYKVSPGQINAILREAEKYEDQGYGYYKRNCTTFVVEMAEAAGIAIDKEPLVPDEMEFRGASGLAVELAEGTAAASYYGAANRISSHMDTDDISYTSFGQKMVTKDDLDHYYDSALGEDVIRKGYSPGALGEILRTSENGVYSAKYKEDLESETFPYLSVLMSDYGEALWEGINSKILLRKRIPLDNEIRLFLASEGDEGIYQLMNKKEEEITPKELRDIHKRVSYRIRVLDKYYRERLGRDSDLNENFMKYISLCETVLSLCDKLYTYAYRMEAKGDTASLKGVYATMTYGITVTDASGTEHTTAMAPGVYEGYLMAGRTPLQAVKEHAEYQRLNALGKSGRSSAEESKFKFLLKVYSLAVDFASANRYIMWKETKDITPEDIAYAFMDLPEMERKHKDGEHVNGVLVENIGPSVIYQAEMFERVFDGMKDNRDITQEGTRVSARIRAIDAYLTQRASERPEFLRKIIQVFCDKKPEEGAGGISILLVSALRNSYLVPVLSGSKVSVNDLNTICTQLESDSNFRRWIIAEANKILGTDKQ